jgi:hypothetical protein
MKRLYSVFAVVWILVSALVVVVVDSADSRPQAPQHSTEE